MNGPTRTATVLLGILTTIMVGWVLHVGAAVLQPLVIALLLASMLQPVVRGLARWKVPPVLTVILIVTLLFFGLARAGLLLQTNIAAFLGKAPARSSVQAPASAPPLVDVNPSGRGAQGDPGEGAKVADTGEDLGQDPGGSTEPPQETTGSDSKPLEADPLSPGNNALTEGFAGWKAIRTGVIDRMKESSLPEPLVQYLSDTLWKIDVAGLATGVIGGGVDFTKGLLLVVIYMLFIFAEQAVFRRKILSVSGSRRDDAARVLDTIGRGIQRYLGVKTLVSFATGALCYAVLVALDIPFALLFGFLTFLLNYIPTFGSIIAGILPVTTALAEGAPWNRVLAIFFTYLAVNLVLGSILEPRILGRELNLSPLVIIVSVVIWAALWGLIGTFLAVPLTAAAQIILASQENTRPIAVLLSSGPPRDRPPVDSTLAKLSSRIPAGRKSHADAHEVGASQD